MDDSIDLSLIKVSVPEATLATVIVYMFQDNSLCIDLDKLFAQSSTQKDLWDPEFSFFGGEHSSKILVNDTQKVDHYPHGYHPSKIKKMRDLENKKSKGKKRRSFGNQMTLVVRLRLPTTNCTANTTITNPAPASYYYTSCKLCQNGTIHIAGAKYEDRDAPLIAGRVKCMLDRMFQQSPEIFKKNKAKTGLPYRPRMKKQLAVKNYRFAFNLNNLNLAIDTDQYIDCLKYELGIYKENKSKRFKGIMGFFESNKKVLNLELPKIGFSFAVWKSGRVVVYSKSGLISDTHLCRDLLQYLFKHRQILRRTID